MGYDNIISRTDAAALIPEEVARDLWNRVTTQSAALNLFRRIAVSRAQVRIPVVSALPVAYWVTGDTGLKHTTEVNWANKYLNIEEIAAIVPIPMAVLEDADFDIWGEIQPLLVEAIGRTLDSAIFFGTNAPASFPTNISSAAASASNTVAETLAASAGGFFGDIDAALALIEADGFDMSGVVASRSARGRFRSARNADGDRLDQARVSQALDNLDGVPVVYPMRGLFPSTVRLFVGDWTQFVIGVRQDINFRILTEASIYDNTGTLMYALAQQDMVAARVTFRAGWQVSNLINHDQPTEASRYPVARLTYTP
jgi:HK97 family phage major capsid protein